MGKSGGRKKKSGASQNQTPKTTVDNNPPPPPPAVNGGVHLDASFFLKKAHELKEEGNKRFQAKDYVAALQQYENAIKLTPKTHPDRAVFHSNRAACLMQMKPINYETVISECNLALQVQPNFVRALLRRARAFEAIGKYEMAVQDIQSLLLAEPNHSDALEIAGRLRTALGTRQDAQQDLHSRPSPAALGASAVRGAPIAGLGPCLPARPVPKKQPLPLITKSENLYPIPPLENGPETKNQMPKVALKPSNGPSRPNSNIIASKDSQKEQSTHPSSLLGQSQQQATIKYRPLKLVYDHDIRLAQMPVNCSFKCLRDVVSKCFPMSKAVLIKYKDSDGDLVTITCSAELRLAESSVDIGDSSIGMLRLHIVEVSPEQEPPLLEEEEEEVKPLKLEPAKADETDEKVGTSEDPECKEVEIDDWLFEFAQLFRAHVGIDPDAHIDLHEIGMELCTEALEETVTGEEALALFNRATVKFQEVAALAFFNWGNVYMCAARKRMPIDETSGKETMNTQLQDAYNWVRENYSLAREKYEQALGIKSDFYEGLLAIGQQQFEMAKLHWSFQLAKKTDLSQWDPTETISLFNGAEEKMRLATKMWEKAEEQRREEPKGDITKKDELSKRRKKQGEPEVSPDEAAENVAVMRSQIHLFWGNMLFERSQIECRLGLEGWEKNLDDAVGRFKLAGASEVDIAAVLKNHFSNEGVGMSVEEEKVVVIEN